MDNIDLSILKKIPEPNLKVILEIRPLAPLSMVSELPGSYYKTLKSPSKKMLCGLFENILGWHIDLADRKVIIKELAALRKSQAKRNLQLEFIEKTKGSTYSPLLMDYFDVVLPVIPAIGFYDDLWSKSYRRADAIVHPKGTFNLDYGIIPIKRQQLNKKIGRGNPKLTLKERGLSAITTLSPIKPCLQYRIDKKGKPDMYNVCIIPDLTLAELKSFIQVFKRLRSIGSDGDLMMGNVLPKHAGKGKSENITYEAKLPRKYITSPKAVMSLIFWEQAISNPA